MPAYQNTIFNLKTDKIMNSDINKQAAKSAAKVAEQAAKVSAAAANVAIKQEAKAQKSEISDKIESAKEMIQEKGSDLKDKVKNLTSKGLEAAAKAADFLADKARNGADALS